MGIQSLQSMPSNFEVLKQNLNHQIWTFLSSKSHCSELQRAQTKLKHNDKYLNVEQFKW